MWGKKLFLMRYYKRFKLQISENANSSSYFILTIKFLLEGDQKKKGISESGP